MVTFFICLITGFFIIIPSSYAMGVFWLTVSCVTYLPLLYLPWHAGSIPSTSTVYTLIDGCNSQLQTVRQASNYKKRFDLSIVLTIVFPLYTVNYLVALFGGINAAQTIAIYQVLSVLTKGLFTAVTMDMHLDSLVQSRRAALEANDRRTNEARRAFLKYIFHEVRSPLNSLSIGIEVLERSRNLDEMDIESLEMMRNASEFMSDTLNDVLSMQKIEEGKLELDLSPFCISDAISKVFSTFRGAVTAKQIELLKIVDPLVPMRIVGDRYRIEHVIANLLSNAIKFSSIHTAIQVSATLIQSQPGSEMMLGSTATIRIAVKDEGPGISKENQKKLFGNFVQIRPGQLQEGKGSGLGLSLCKQLVHLHGGNIGVVSEEGQGSEFFFVIPFKVHFDVASISNISNFGFDAEDDKNVNAQEVSIVENFISSHHNKPFGVLVVDG